MRTDQKETIRQFNGRVVGYIETNSKTNEGLARDFYGRIIGYYDPNQGNRTVNGKKQGCTRDFYGRIVGYGNLLYGMVWNPRYNKCIDVEKLDK